MDAVHPDLAELNILTLNCWGLLYLSAQRAVRLQEIGRAIASSTPAPHIVALQECWTQEDYQSIRRATRFILPYGKFYHSGVFGGGLAILSKWPIEESSMYQYPLNGRPTAFFRGDWFVGKGVACAKIRFGKAPREVVEVFNTHTHPNYEHGSSCSYTAHRLSQAWELAKLLRGAAARGHLVLALGDFNTEPLSMMHRIITSHSPVRDVWRVLHPESSLGAAEEDLERNRRRPIPTAQFNIEENGATSNNVYNTWRWPKPQQKLLGAGRESDWPTVAADTLDPKGKRLDYIFASSGLIEGETAGWSWVVHDARVGMMDRHPELGCSLSDHFSVEATLVLHRTETVPPSSSLSHHRSRSVNRSRSSIPFPTAAASLAETRNTEIPTPQLENGVYLQSPEASETNLPLPAPRPRDPNAPSSSSYSAQLETASHSVSYLPSSTYDEILDEIRKYQTRQGFQQRWRGIHFGTWLVVAIVCYIGVWWTPPYVAFILMLLSSLGLAAGVVDGLIALLFVNSEMRALREFEWEVMNAKATATGAGGPGFEDETHGSSREGSRENKW
ncbi:Endonuclease/exonuclease/phosphatase [Truncatella angustata]|uniref:Endonuclease/exonuclease/phosphatase n=1 Tax=Truncatella angustata TaxID=152316 RepID=A0A9P9A1X3_9PEZI|nr:Endonuclease/exonuclease/phosphatase [Truncatella angustata]KAH6660046.1 Endonuclease/exonuclease/phosphatase [Truncatella angustata]